MVDIEKFVKKNFPKVQKLGLNIESSEKEAEQGMKGYPPRMIENFDEDELVSYMLFGIKCSDVFATDFEGVEYEEFLEWCMNISDGELDFSEVTFDVDKKVWEKGEGTAEVSFKFNGEKYDYTAQVYYDWFDQKFISFLNEIFEKRGMAKRLIIFGNPNGAFFTYKTPDFCQRLKEEFPMLEADVL